MRPDLIVDAPVFCTINGLNYSLSPIQHCFDRSTDERTTLQLLRITCFACRLRTETEERTISRETRKKGPRTPAVTPEIGRRKKTIVIGSRRSSSAKSPTAKYIPTRGECTVQSKEGLSFFFLEGAGFSPCARRPRRKNQADSKVSVSECDRVSVFLLRLAQHRCKGAQSSFHSWEYRSPLFFFLSLFPRFRSAKIGS